MSLVTSAATITRANDTNWLRTVVIPMEHFTGSGLGRAITIKDLTQKLVIGTNIIIGSDKVIPPQQGTVRVGLTPGNYQLFFEGINEPISFPVPTNNPCPCLLQDLATNGLYTVSSLGGMSSASGLTNGSSPTFNVLTSTNTARLQSIFTGGIYDSSDDSQAINISERQLFDPQGHETLDFAGRALYDGIPVLNWANGININTNVAVTGVITSGNFIGPLTGNADSATTAATVTAVAVGVTNKWRAEISASNSLSTPVQSLLVPNLPGPTRGITYRNGTPEGTGQGPSGKGLAYFGAGVSGVISSFKWTDASGHDADGLLRSNLVLRVYVDAGNIANADNIPTNYLTIAAPLNMLLNSVWKPVDSTPVVKNTRYIDTQAILSSGNVGFNLKLPILFTNGVFIGMFNEHGTNTIYNYSSANYKLGPLNFPYSNYRLRSCFFHTNSTFGFASGAVGERNNFMTVTNAPGFLVGISYANQGTTNFSEWPEGNWMFQVDGASPTQSDSTLYSDIGGEDLFFNSYYFANGSYIGYDFGTPYVASPTFSGVTYNIRVDAYRWFVPTEFITWTTSIFCSRVIHNDTTNNQEDFLTWYYSSGGQTILYTNPVPYTPPLPTDTDAANFFTRSSASGTPIGASQQTIVNILVTSAKAHGWWNAYTNGFIYLFLGGETNNLINNSVGGWIGQGTYTTNSSGFTGNGTTGCANSKWRPSALGFSPTNIAWYVYADTNSVVSATSPIGAENLTYGNITYNLPGGFQVWSARGPDSSAGTASPDLAFLNGADKNVYSVRTNAATISLFSGSLISSASQANGSIENCECYIAAANEGNPSPNYLYKGTIKFAAAGTGIVSPTTIQQMFTDVTVFETSLGRQ